MTLPLRERVEALAGGDREMDCRLALRFAVGDFNKDMCQSPDYPGNIALLRKYQCGDITGECRECGSTLTTGDGIPEFTASLDAALALVERIAPDKCWSITKNWWPEGHEKAKAEAFAADLYPGTSDITAPTAPLALLAALLRSMEADAEHEEAGG